MDLERRFIERFGKQEWEQMVARAMAKGAIQSPDNYCTQCGQNLATGRVCGATHLRQKREAGIEG